MLLALLFAFAGWASPGPALADDATATPTATSTATPQPTATTPPTATAIPPPTATATPRVHAVPTRETTINRVRHHRKRSHSPHPSVTAVRETPTPTPVPEKHRGRQHHHAKPAKPKPTSTPTPTPVPALSLSTEDSVKPVTCNRGPAGPAPAPFLIPPYHGWTSVVSYLDHDSPNFVQDGLIITAAGLQAAADSTHQRSDFPAYWNRGLRQYVYYDGHNGYDYNVSYQPLYAAAAGKVIFARFEYRDAPDHGYGKMVMIQHRHGYVTLYGHLSRLLVHAGEKVRAGQEIGISGNTGHSTGPHLHFTVFHNCTPTDPYGWSGPGPDPLSAYQGETSEYLWTRAPLIANPLPRWPGLAALPAAPSERLVLLRLPDTSRGTDTFLADLRAEADAAARTLHAAGATVHEDLIRGLLAVDGPVAPDAIYRVAGVASIASPDTIDGAKDDMLAALARAALVRPAHALVLSRAHHWSGFLLRWQGRTLLVGRGSKGARVDLRLASGRGGSWHRIAADPRTGAYAIDLGPMSIQQFRQLDAALQQRQRHGSASVEPVIHNRSHLAPSRPGGASFPYAWLGAGILLFAGALTTAVLRRRLFPAGSPGNGPRDQSE